MTLDEKIGQLFMVAAYSNQGEAHENTIEAQIRKYHLGGIIFFQGDPARQVLLTNRFQRAAKYPLLIGLDAEHGAGWRLEGGMEFPKMGVVGAVGNDSLVLALGQAIARHCREIGVHVNFAPVVDVNSNPANPVIGIRSFGEDPETVAQKAILFMKGLCTLTGAQAQNFFMTYTVTMILIRLFGSHMFDTLPRYRVVPLCALGLAVSMAGTSANLASMSSLSVFVFMSL